MGSRSSAGVPREPERERAAVLSRPKRVRLPLAGDEPVELPPVDDALRLAFGAPCIAVVGVERGLAEGALEVLRGACASSAVRHAELHAVLASREGARHEPPRLEASLPEMPAALLDAERRLPAHALVLSSGVALVAIRRPTVSILVTRGRSPGDWRIDVRSVRHRFELIVPELEPALARELVVRLATAGRS